MYFARYATEAVSLSQVIVRIRTVTIVTKGDINVWNETYCSFLEQLLDWNKADISMRIQLRDRNLTRLLIITTPSTFEDEVRQLIRMMIDRLNALSDNSVDSPSEASEHNRMAEDYPSCAVQLPHAPLTTEYGTIIHNYKLASTMQAIFSYAFVNSIAFCYQLNTRRFQASTESIAAIRFNLLKLANHDCMPEPLLRYQEEVADRYTCSELLTNEYICVQQERLWPRIADIVQNVLNRTSHLNGCTVTLARVVSQTQDHPCIAMGVHESWLQQLDPMSEASQSAKIGWLMHVLSWQPSEPYTNSALRNVVTLDRQSHHSSSVSIHSDAVNLVVDNRIQHMQNNNVSVTLGNGVTVIGDIIVANRISSSFSRTELVKDDTIKHALQQIVTLVGKAADKMPPENAELASKNLQSLIDEVTNPKPRREWYELSAKGIKEAVAAVADFAGPIIAAVDHVLSLMRGR